jgi:outer membrane protein assembly factor BamB
MSTTAFRCFPTTHHSKVQRMVRFLPPLLCVLLFFSTSGRVGAEDWPSWQGINRDSKSPETGLLTEWPEGGPQLAWKSKTVGLGYSSPAIVGETLYITGSRDGKSELIALSAKDGTETWSLTLNEKPFDFDGNAWGIGPRAAPTVANDCVYALSGDGVLVCTSLTGEEKWRTEMVQDLNGSVDPIGGGPKVYGWGYCWSPLADEGKLICVPGGEDGMIAALDPASGKVLWRCSELTGMATYASPIVATIHGVRQYIVMTQSGMASVAAEDGALLWNYVLTNPFSDVVISTPVYQENKVYYSVGYGSGGCDVLEVSPDWKVESTYERRAARNMKNKQGGFVLLEGYVYGCSDRRGWICQDLNSGDLEWYKRGEIGDGSLAYADGHLYLFDERKGEVGLVEASNEAWILKSRFTLPALSEKKAPSGRIWTHPAIADGKLYLRDQELLYCYDIK